MTTLTLTHSWSIKSYSKIKTSEYKLTSDKKEGNKTKLIYLRNKTL